MLAGVGGRGALSHVWLGQIKAKMMDVHCTVHCTPGILASASRAMPSASAFQHLLSSQNLLIFWYSLLPEKVYNKFRMEKFFNMLLSFLLKEVSERLLAGTWIAQCLGGLHLGWDIEEKEPDFDADNCLLVYLLHILWISRIL
jgi:hypothetical protein